MTHRYTFIRSRGFVSGGKCGICKREYSGANTERQFIKDVP